MLICASLLKTAQVCTWCDCWDLTGRTLTNFIWQRGTILGLQAGVFTSRCFGGAKCRQISGSILDSVQAYRQFKRRIMLIIFARFSSRFVKNLLQVARNCSVATKLTEMFCSTLLELVTSTKSLEPTPAEILKYGKWEMKGLFTRSTDGQWRTQERLPLATDLFWLCQSLPRHLLLCEGVLFCIGRYLPIRVDLLNSNMTSQSSILSPWSQSRFLWYLGHSILYGTVSRFSMLF